MRASGVIMHISSLPSPHGIGTMGEAAYRFVDFLARAGQKYWQVLPLGPTGYGNSPYQASSAFAGNPNFIDLDDLVREGLLTSKEVETRYWGENPEKVDYGALYAGRYDLLYLAYSRGWERDIERVGAFYAENADWLRSYALFSAAKRYFGMKPWTEWEDEELRLRRSDKVLRRYEEELRDDIRCCIYTEYQFFRQWEALRSYAEKAGVRIIGDVPIYVPLDSADVWAESRYFQLDGRGRPRAVAGVPPDYFSADGQLWGNPLYDWEAMRSDGYGWWLRRIASSAKLYDAIRIDHFRGFESYWAVPYGEKTARNGIWVKGPGREFIAAVRAKSPNLGIIAEDLGLLTPDVLALRKFSGFPGMKVLQFAFDADGESDYLPHRYDKNCICYTGTHDNATLRQWVEEAKPEEIEFAMEYMGTRKKDDCHAALLRLGMASVAELFMAQMQDWLDLPGSARMNTPGVLSADNWSWRMLSNSATDELAERMARMARLYGR